jgi:hypothetical protein
MTQNQKMKQRKVPRQAFYCWKRRFAGLRVSELGELRQLREENQKLKTPVADLTLGQTYLQDVYQKQSEASGSSRVGAQCLPGVPTQQEARLWADVRLRTDPIRTMQCRRPFRYLSGLCNAAPGVCHFWIRAIFVRTRLAIPKEKNEIDYRYKEPPPASACVMQSSNRNRNSRNKYR